MQIIYGLCLKISLVEQGENIKASSNISNNKVNANHFVLGLQATNKSITV